MALGVAGSSPVIHPMKKHLALFAKRFFSYIRLAASGIAFGGDIMLRIVILPAAVKAANIIPQKPGGFYITFRKGKYHSGLSTEYHYCP